MKNNKFWIIGIVAILVITGAYYAYNTLSAGLDPDKLEQITPDTAPPETDANSAKILAPDFKVYDIENKEVNLYDFTSQPIVINFWASWCPPCRAEMDYFQEAFDFYSEKGVKFFMINATDGDRETIETATKYFTENSYTMDLYFDLDFNASQKYDVRSLPMTFFIDSKGNMVNYHLGTTDKDTLFKNIDSLVK